MFYKALYEGNVVDAYDGLQYVRYDDRAKMFLRCKKNEAQGVIERNGACIFHVDGWPEFPEEVQERVECTIILEEVEEADYLALKSLLDAGQTPENPEPEPEPEPETDEETLAWAKNRKIALSKTVLASYLEANPIVSTAHNGVPGTYAVTSEKQQLMSMNYQTYLVKKGAGMEAELTWNETGKECEVWTEAEFVQLIIEIEAYVKPLVSKQQSIEMQVQAAETLREVDEIEIVY